MVISKPHTVYSVKPGTIFRLNINSPHSPFVYMKLNHYIFELSTGLKKEIHASHNVTILYEPSTVLTNILTQLFKGKI